MNQITQNSYLKMASSLIQQMKSGSQNTDVKLISDTLSRHSNIFDINNNRKPDTSEVAALLTVANRNCDKNISTDELMELKSKLDAMKNAPNGKIEGPSGPRNKGDGIVFESDTDINALADEVKGLELEYRNTLESTNNNTSSVTPNTNVRQSKLGQSIAAFFPTKDAPKAEQSDSGTQVRQSNLGKSIAAFFPTRKD